VNTLRISTVGYTHNIIKGTLVPLAVIDECAMTALLFGVIKFFVGRTDLSLSRMREMYFSTKTRASNDSRRLEVHYKMPGWRIPPF
jgi:hypothetical protein